MTDETPMVPNTTTDETEATAPALALTPPAAVPAVSQKQAAASMQVDEATAK